VTHADGTVTDVLPDGTSLSDIGPQTYWDAQTNQLKDGRPSQWPTPPLEEDDDEEFVVGEWNWFQEPEDHAKAVSLGDRLVAFWAMDGEEGGIEPDLANTNDLATVGGAPGAGTTDHFAFRRFDGEADYLQLDDTSAFEDPLRFWMAFPLRPDTVQEQATILKGMWPGGYSIGTSGDGSIGLAIGNSRLGVKSTSFSGYTDDFRVVQMWSDPVRARIGFRIGTAETVFDGAYASLVTTQRNRALTVGSRPGGGFYFAGDVGPLLVAHCAPTREDRDWLANDGAFRSLSEIENYTVPLLDI
jgi:hypothetical protein